MREMLLANIFDFWQWAVGLLLVLVYGLVDKVVIPLASKKHGGEQDYINKRTAERLVSIENEVSATKATVGEIARIVDLTKSLVDRMDRDE